MSFVIRKPDVRLVPNRMAGTTKAMTRKQLAFNNSEGPFLPGFPALGPAESGVTAQFLFDEPSGDIADEVAGLTLTPSGSITYNQPIPSDSPFYPLSPGVVFSNGSRFNKNTDTPSLSPGTGAIVVEWWGGLNNTVGSSGDYALVFSIDSDTGTRGFTIYQQYDIPTVLLIDIHGSTGNRNLSWTIPDLRDNRDRKFRWKYDPLTEKSTLVIQGESYGEIDTSTIGSIDAFHVGISNGSFTYRGKLYGLRYTLGNANANAGGPGGG